MAALKNSEFAFNEELLKLSRISSIDAGDIENSFEFITEAIARALNVGRASIWLLNQDQTAIVCQKLYEASSNKHDAGIELKAKDFPAYFKYLSEERTLHADDAHMDSATYEFSEVYLRPLNIVSLLDAPIRVNGKMVGVICCEQLMEKRYWSISEQNFAGNIADIVARALQARERTQALLKLEAMNLQLEQIVKDRTAELEEQRIRSAHASKMAVLGEMAGAIAHEINNPLAIISLCSHQLLKMNEKGKLTSDALKNILKDISSTTIRIEKIIKGLRFFARDASQDEFSHSKISQIIDDTLSLCQEKFKKHGCEVQLMPLTQDLILNCQPVSISQALLNLLSNSFDAVSELKEKWIRLECRVFSDYVEIHIIDSGNGIPIEIRDKIMVPFFTTKPIGKGTGLGLAIVRGIIEQHRGEFYFDDSSINTAFVIRLPKIE